jgi:hypothetical protein
MHDVWAHPLDLLKNCNETGVTLWNLKLTLNVPNNMAMAFWKGFLKAHLTQVF